MTLGIYLTLKILHFVRFYFELKEKINFNAFFKNPFYSAIGGSWRPAWKKWCNERCKGKFLLCEL